MRFQAGFCALLLFRSGFAVSGGFGAISERWVAISKPLLASGRPAA